MAIKSPVLKFYCWPQRFRVLGKLRPAFRRPRAAAGSPLPTASRQALRSRATQATSSSAAGPGGTVTGPSSPAQRGAGSQLGKP
eukprot:470535-Hanusia_phi.AAC.2